MPITHSFVSAKTQSGDTSVVSKNEWNADHVITGLEVGFIGCEAKRTTDQTIATEGAVVAFNASDTFDTDGFHDTVTNNSRITIPTGLGGKYLVTGYLIWGPAAYGASTLKQARIYKNGNPAGFGQGQDGNSAAYAQQVVSGVLDLVPGDYLELFAYHNRGSDGSVVGSVGNLRLSVVKLDAGRVGSGVGARAYHSTTQSIGTGSWTSLSLDSEEFDTDAFHSVSSNTSRITVPTGLGGKYLVTGQVGFAANTTGGRYVRIYKNGSTEVRAAGNQVKSDGSAVSMQQVTTILDLSAGDYIELQAFQDSGGDLNVGTATTYYQTSLSVMRIDSRPINNGSFVGYNTAGGSWVNVNGTYAKKVTLQQGMVMNIGAYLKGNTVNAGSIGVALLTDNSGSPGRLVARGPSTAYDFADLKNTFSLAMDSTGRWVESPLNAYVTTGDYWLVVFGGIGADNAGTQLAYDGSGADYTQASGYPFDGTFSAYSSGSNKYSIRALHLPMSVG